MSQVKNGVHINFPTDDVFAAACAAFRINGAYLKDTVFDLKGEIVSYSNRTTLVRLLSENVDKITDEDRTQGKLVRQYYQGLTFKILGGKYLSSFDKSAMEFAGLEKIKDALQVSVIASLPKCYLISKQRDEGNMKLQNAIEHIGNIGDRVTLGIVVVKSIYSRNYNTYYITAITDDNKAVLFSFSKEAKIGDKLKIKGTVKMHGEEYALNNKYTQLNRVKIVDNL
jgi:hypothetical protein